MLPVLVILSLGYHCRAQLPGRNQRCDGKYLKGTSQVNPFICKWVITPSKSLEYSLEYSIRPPPRLEILEGGQATITCFNRDISTVNWFILSPQLILIDDANRQAICDCVSVRISSSRVNLTFTNFRQQSAGLFTCAGENILGDDFFCDFTVAVEGKFYNSSWLKAVYIL